MHRLERWSLVAEIVAAVAVVLSIAYLTVEVQRNTKAVQSQTSQGLLEMANQRNDRLAMDPGLADLLNRVIEDLDAPMDQRRTQHLGARLLQPRQRDDG